MSHQPERTEKNCLNCGNTVLGRYCHVCGQENIVPKQNFIALTKHFIYDLLHFDGKFFETLRKLLFKPGQVAKEYTAGKRNSHLDPIRMYLFTSAIFFIIFFAIAGPAGVVSSKNNYLSMEDRKTLIDSFTLQINKGHEDSARFRKYLEKLSDTTRNLSLSEVGGSGRIFGSDKDPATVAAYDSIQKSKPDAEKDSWLRRLFIRKSIDINEKYSGNAEKGLNDFTSTLLHYFPYMLFLSLPFFAGTLKLLYRRRKNFYYSDHAVFTLYHYVFGFINLLLILVFSALDDVWDIFLFNWLITILIIWWIVYLFLGMKRFYGQGYTITFIKFLLQSLLNFLILLILLFIFLIFSIFQL